MRALWCTRWNAGIASGLVDLGQPRQRLGYFSTWMTLDVSVACAKRGTYGGRIRRPRSACVMNTSRGQGVNTLRASRLDTGYSSCCCVQLALCDDQDDVVSYRALHCTHLGARGRGEGVLASRARPPSRSRRRRAPRRRPHAPRDASRAASGAARR